MKRLKEICASNYEANKAAKGFISEVVALVVGGEPGKDEGIFRAALAHLRFLTGHPFEDGNG